MATKNYYATGDFRYGTRMLRAGDGPFPMSGPQARLYGALGKISDKKPAAAKGAVAPAPAPTLAAKAPPKPKAQRKPRARKAAAKKPAAKKPAAAK